MLVRSSTAVCRCLVSVWHQLPQDLPGDTTGSIWRNILCSSGWRHRFMPSRRWTVSIIGLIVQWNCHTIARDCRDMHRHACPRHIL